MNFIAATVELKSFDSDPVNVYGLNYISGNAVIPAASNSSEVRVRILCYNNSGPKLNAFQSWKPGTRALITGNISFSDNPSDPLDLIINTIESNIPQEMYCNQVVLGNAFFADSEYKERKNDQVAVKIGTTLDDSEVVTWLYMETHASRKSKLSKRLRKGRQICVQGYIREYRKDDNDSPYRAIVASDFSTRKDKERSSRNPQSSGTAAGYTELDPTPDY